MVFRAYTLTISFTVLEIMVVRLSSLSLATSVEDHVTSTLSTFIDRMKDPRGLVKEQDASSCLFSMAVPTVPLSTTARQKMTS